MNINFLRQTSHPLFSRVPVSSTSTDTDLKLTTVRRIPQISDRLMENDGRNDQLIIKAAKREENTKTVNDLVRKSNRILVSISSHAFPFDIFPDTLNAEESRITVIKRHFLSSEVHSIDIRDISNVFINTTFFFSQLVIVSRTFENNEIRLRNLITRDAVYIRRIIEGLRIFENKQIDTSQYSQQELVAKLEQLSTTEIVT